ncbi:hypothetical protein AB0G95_21820 [Streptomyces virginiae]|uniref:hypothetical protein n=1 Tax=Streptomyces virginiae TaxID=1961 RepID=UPI0034296A0E
MTTDAVPALRWRRIDPDAMVKQDPVPYLAGYLDVDDARDGWSYDLFVNRAGTRGRIIRVDVDRVVWQAAPVADQAAGLAALDAIRAAAAGQENPG